MKDGADLDRASARAKLMLSTEEMRELGYGIVDRIVDHVANLESKRAVTIARRSDLERAFREPAPEAGSDPAAVMERLDRDFFPNLTYVGHPRFFAFVPIPGNFVGAMGDALASGFNVFAGTWFGGSAAAELELVTIDWLREICGFPKTAGGLYVSGGSMANLVALAVARDRRLGEEFGDGVVYASDQTHSSVGRALKILGFPAERVRFLASDDRFRLPVGALARAIAADRAAGLRPFCVVANGGTTNTGAVDPLNAIAELCRREELWLHVDGAYGAPAILTATGRAALSGLERADSITLDPHKWLFQPIEMGCLLVRERDDLRSTFRVLPEYLRDVARSDEEINFCDFGPQLSRGTRALKLWMTIQVFGMKAIRGAVAHGIGLAEIAEDEVRRHREFEIATAAELGIVTFRAVPATPDDAASDRLNKAVADAIVADGFAGLSTTALRGRTVLRLCTNHARTTEEDVRATVRLLASLAVRWRQASPR